MKRFLVLLSFVAVVGITTLIPSAISAKPIAVPVDLKFEIDIPTERHKEYEYHGERRYGEHGRRGPKHCKWVKGHWELGYHNQWDWVEGYKTCWSDRRGGRW